MSFTTLSFSLLETTTVLLSFFSSYVFKMYFLIKLLSMVGYQKESHKTGNSTFALAEFYTRCSSWHNLKRYLCLQVNTNQKPSTCQAVVVTTTPWSHYITFWGVILITFYYISNVRWWRYLYAILKRCTGKRPLLQV